MEALRHREISIGAKCGGRREAKNTAAVVNHAGHASRFAPAKFPFMGFGPMAGGLGGPCDSGARIRTRASGAVAPQMPHPLASVTISS